MAKSERIYIVVVVSGVLNKNMDFLYRKVVQLTCRYKGKCVVELVYGGEIGDGSNAVNKLCAALQQAKRRADRVVYAPRGNMRDSRTVDLSGVEKINYGPGGVSSTARDIAGRVVELIA